MTDLMSGDVQMFITPGPVVAPYVNSGKVKTLAVTSAKPSKLLPGLHTVAAELPGYEAPYFNGMFAPAVTPIAIINLLNQRVAQILNKADIKEKFFNAGAETIGSSPNEFAVKVKSEIAKWSVVIKSAGIKAD